MNLAGRISFLPCFSRQERAQVRCKWRHLAGSLNVSVGPWNREKQIFGCWVAMNKYLPVFIPHPRVGLALRLIRWAFFCVCFVSLQGVFPSFPNPPVGFGLGGRFSRTKLLHVTRKAAEVGWGPADQGGLMSGVGKGEASLNTEWVKLTSGEGRRKPEAEKRRWRGTVCALSHILCCLLKLEGCEQK